MRNRFEIGKRWLVAVVVSCGVAWWPCESAAVTLTKELATCQKKIVAGATKYLAKRLDAIQDCATQALGCVQGDDPKCSKKASKSCTKRLGKIPGLQLKLEKAIVAACGAIPLSQLADEEGGLGFAGVVADCAASGATVADAPSLASCLIQRADRIIDRALAVELPRAREVIDQTRPASCPLLELPRYRGCELCSLRTDDGGRVAKCTKSLAKSGEALLAALLKAYRGSCVDRLLKCATADAAHLAKCRQSAAEKCGEQLATLPRASLETTVSAAGACGAGALDFGLLQSPRGANLEALACQCDAVGVDGVATFDDYGRCVRRHFECATTRLLRVIVPRVDQLFEDVDLSVTSSACVNESLATPSNSAASRAALLPIRSFLNAVRAKFSNNVVKTPTFRPGVTRPPNPGGRQPPVKIGGPRRFGPLGKSTIRVSYSSSKHRGVAPTLLLGVIRLDGSFVASDSFEVPLEEDANEVALDLEYPADVRTCDLVLGFALDEGGVVSEYVPFEQRAIGSADPTLTFVGAQPAGFGGPGVGGVSDLRITADGTFLVATSVPARSIASYRRDADTGALTPTDVQQEAATNVTSMFLALDPDGTRFYVGNNLAVTFSSLGRPLKRFDSVVQLWTIDPSSGSLDLTPQTRRQGFRALHSLARLPNSARLYFSTTESLGITTLQYPPRLHPRLESIDVDPFASFNGEVPDGASSGSNGISNLVTTRDGSFAYASAPGFPPIPLGNGASSLKTNQQIRAFKRQDGAGTLQFVQALEDDVSADAISNVSALTLSPDDRYLYAASRGDNAVATFEVDPSTGVLTQRDAFFGGVCAGGLFDGPGDIGATPDGAAMFVTSTTTSNLTVLRRDTSSGLITVVGQKIDGVDGVSGIGNPTSLAVSPDGKYLYVGSSVSDTIATFAIGTSAQ